MLRTIVRKQDGRATVLLGLDAVNLFRLAQGQPIDVDLEELFAAVDKVAPDLATAGDEKLRSCSVLLVAGETLEMVQRDILGWAGAKPQ